MGSIKYFDELIILLFGLLWIGFIAYLSVKERKDLTYLLFFTIFYVYVFKVLDYTLFQFQSLLLLKYFMPHLILKGETAGRSINLTPLVTLSPQDIITSLLNILLFIPFGFGLPFIMNVRLKKILIIGASFSILIELMQLITGILAKITFRVVDINDVIFNTLGVAVGYILFVRFVYLFCHIFHTKRIVKHPILQYIFNRPQVNKKSK